MSSCRFGIGHPFQPQQAFLARSQAPVHHTIDTASQVDTRREQNPDQHLHGTLESAHRRLQQRGANSAADHDQRCRAVGQGPKMTTFQVIAANNGDERHDNADQAKHIHYRHASTRCLPMSSNPYTASARSALTMAIGMP